jgi:hypothetical protein
MTYLTDDEMMVYEISTDGGKNWQEVEYEEVEQAVRRCYTDGGIILANLHDGVIVITLRGKFRARPFGNPYLRKTTGFDRPSHIVCEDGQTSKCGAASVGGGYELVYREKVLESMTCTNCLTGRKVR